MDIISLTAIPTRFKHMRPCVESLEKQGLPVHIYIPRYFKREKTDVDQIPDYLEKHCIVHLVEDEGSITKLRPALRRSATDRILTADDDIEYPEGWAETLLEYSEQYPESVVAYRGRRMVKHRRYRKNSVAEKVNEPTKVNFVTGVKGVLYRKQFFSREFIDSTEFTTVDDIDISTELNKNDVDILVVPWPGDIRTLSHHKVTPLCKQNVSRKSISRNDKELENKGYWKVMKSL